MSRLWLIALLAILSPTAAFAQVYAVAQLGYARADFPLGEPYNGVLDDSSIVYGVDVGFGFRKWAAEIGWNGYGAFDGNATPCATGTVCTPTRVEVPNNDQRVYKVSLVRRFDIAKLGFYGKAGYYRAKVSTNIDLPDANLDIDGLLLAAGIRWNFGDKPWTVGVEVSRYDDNVSQLTVGFGWRTQVLGN